MSYRVTDEIIRIANKKEELTPEEKKIMSDFIAARAAGETEAIWRIRRGQNYNPFENESSTK